MNGSLVRRCHLVSYCKANSYQSFQDLHFEVKKDIMIAPCQQKLGHFAEMSQSVMIEDANDGVAMVPGAYRRAILQLPHAQAQWTEFGRELQVGRINHVAMLVSDSFANCSIAAK